MSARDDYIKGLRALADVLENHDEVPLPYDGNSVPISAYFLSAADPRAELAAAARAIPCSFRKSVTEDDKYSPGTLKLTGNLHGLRIELVAYRNAVCERVVTGIEERPVEEVVTPAVTRTVTKPVEIVEWRCQSILSPATSEMKVTS